MKEEPKILEEGESTFRNGGGAMCGGIISETRERRDMKKYGVWANAMAYVLPDKQFDLYVKAKKSGNDKKAKKIFDKFAMSRI